MQLALESHLAVSFYNIHYIRYKLVYNGDSAARQNSKQIDNYGAQYGKTYSHAQPSGQSGYKIVFYYFFSISINSLIPSEAPFRIKWLTRPEGS